MTRARELGDRCWIVNERLNGVKERLVMMEARSTSSSWNRKMRAADLGGRHVASGARENTGEVEW